VRTLDQVEAAYFLRCESETLSDLVFRGDIPCARIGDALVFIEDDLIDYLREQIRKQTDARKAALLGATQARRRGRPRNPIPKFDANS